MGWGWDEGEGEGEGESEGEGYVSVKRHVARGEACEAGEYA